MILGITHSPHLWIKRVDVLLYQDNDYNLVKDWAI